MTVNVDAAIAADRGRDDRRDLPRRPVPARQLPAAIRAVRVIDDRHQLLVGPRHPLADARAVTPAQLVGHRIWMPGMAPDSEWAAYYDELAAAFGLAIDVVGPAFGNEALMDEIAESPELATFAGEGTRYLWPDRYDLRRIPVRDPAPVYPMSLIWREDNPHPALADAARPPRRPRADARRRRDLGAELGAPPRAPLAAAGRAAAAHRPAAQADRRATGADAGRARARRGRRARRSSSSRRRGRSARPRRSRRSMSSALGADADAGAHGVRRVVAAGGEVVHQRMRAEGAVAHADAVLGAERRPPAAPGRRPSTLKLTTPTRSCAALPQLVGAHAADRVEAARAAARAAPARARRSAPSPSPAAR